MAPSTLCGILGAFLSTAVVAAEPRVEDVAFTSHDTTLAGSIVWPVDTPPVAALVFVHGSGPQARNLALARRFAENGVAALVYDKRGAGRSGGDYEAEQSVSGPNITLLADDAVAAVELLADRMDPARVPVGLAGISQAGWIAPLAATRTTHARFLLLWSAPVCKVSEEDIYSKHTADQDGPDRPAFEDALAARRHPYVWPAFLGRDTDAAEDLARVRIPGLWIFGDHDGSIPVDLSLRQLDRLRAAGHRYDIRVFPGQGHNNMTATFDAGIDWLRALAASAD
jgi:pimeloyl-ACP methyl ester carboxylesterase